MTRKSKGLRRVPKYGPKFPKFAALTMKAFGGPLHSIHYGFFITKLGKSEYPIFRAKFAARKYLDLIIQDDNYEWTHDFAITTESGVTISGSQLKMLLDYKIKNARTKSWDLPEEYYNRAIYLRSDTPYKAPPIQVRRTRISRKGMILMRDIAKEIDIHPRDARGILRALGVKKPKHGWAWKTREEADEIKQTLQQSRRKSHDPELDD